MFLFFVGGKSVDISFVFGGIGQGERRGDGCWWGGFARKSLSDIFLFGSRSGKLRRAHNFFSFPPFFSGKDAHLPPSPIGGQEKKVLFL